MLEIYFEILKIIALIIGGVGVLIIFAGSVLAGFEFFKKTEFVDIRLKLVSYILLGLDFLIAKDIIETVIIPDERVWTEVLILFLIVIIRVIFSYFTNQELKEIIHRKNSKQEK